MINPNEIRVCRDGDKWCAVRAEGFTNIQECHAGFGSTPQDAVTTLLAAEARVPGRALLAGSWLGDRLALPDLTIILRLLIARMTVPGIDPVEKETCERAATAINDWITETTYPRPPMVTGKAMDHRG